MALTQRLKNIPGAIAAVAVTVLLVALLAGTAPSWFGYQSFVVYGASMEPAMGVGDLAVVAPVSADQLKVGDVITYRRAEQADLAVTHRITAIKADADGNKFFETKGDANNSTDQVMVSDSTVLGKVVYSVPKIGYLVDFARTLEGKIILIGIPAFLLLGMDFLAAVRKSSQSARSAPAQVAAAQLAEARSARSRGDRAAAAAACDRAIAADPHSEEAWLLKAECLEDSSEALACLQGGLTVNPGSVKLRQAVEQMTVAERAAR